MAALVCNVNSGEVTLAANTAKTILQVKAPTNQRVKLKSIGLFGKQPAGGSDTPVKVRATRSTANFGTGSAATPGKANPADAETIQSVCASNFSPEPTTPTDSGLVWYLQPQSGVMQSFPPGTEPEIPGGQAMSFEATSPGTPTIICEVQFEE